MAIVDEVLRKALDIGNNDIFIGEIGCEIDRLLRALIHAAQILRRVVRHVFPHRKGQTPLVSYLLKKRRHIGASLLMEPAIYELESAPEARQISLVQSPFAG